MDPASLQSPPAIVGEVVAGQSAAFRKELMIMVEDIKERTFDLAVALYTTKSEGLYRQWGYTSITHYGEIELGLKESKTQYLVRIVEVMVACGIPREVYEQVGVSKLREIKRLDPAGEFFNGEKLEPLKEHIVRLVNATEMTTSKVRAEVDRLLGMVEGNRMIMRTIGFTESAWTNTIERAVEIVRKQMGSKGRDTDGVAEDYSIGKCIEMICADFIADPNNDDPDQAVILESEPDTQNTFGDIPMEPTI